MMQQQQRPRALLGAVAFPPGSLKHAAAATTTRKFVGPLRSGTALSATVHRQQQQLQHRKMTAAMTAMSGAPQQRSARSSCTLRRGRASSLRQNGGTKLFSSSSSSSSSRLLLSVSCQAAASPSSSDGGGEELGKDWRGVRDTTDEPSSSANDESSSRSSSSINPLRDAAAAAEDALNLLAHIAVPFSERPEQKEKRLEKEEAADRSTKSTEDNGEHLVAEVSAAVAQAKAAQEKYRTFKQEQVDEIFHAAAAAAIRSRIALARLAVEETKMGVVEDKVIQLQVAAELTFDRYKSLRTCGVVGGDEALGLVTVAEPVGVIAGVLSATNPCAAAVSLALLALKTRNALVLSPHPCAPRATAAAARAVRDAAEAAGAPPGLIQCLEHPSVGLAKALMEDRRISLVVASGGASLIKAAFSSGHAAFGAGPGNAPAVIDASADIRHAVSSVMQSKTFDNGLGSGSEQSVIVVDPAFDAVMAEFRRQGATVLPPDAVSAAREGMVGGDGRHSMRMRPELKGQGAERVAELLGVEVPRGTRVLLGEVTEVGPKEPWSGEKLFPLLALYRARSFDAAAALAERLVEHGGQGHTAVLHVDERTGADKVEKLSGRVSVGRLLVNQPATQGAVGQWFSPALDPGFLSGCGTWGGGGSSANLSPQMLLNFKTVAVRIDESDDDDDPPGASPAHKGTPRICFANGAFDQGLRELGENFSRPLVVTDDHLVQTGLAEKACALLMEAGVAETDIRVFADTRSGVATAAAVSAGLAAMREHRPDLVVAVGGGSVIDTAKAIRLLYELGLPAAPSSSSSSPPSGAAAAQAPSAMTERSPPDAAAAPGVIGKAAEAAAAAAAAAEGHEEGEEKAEAASQQPQPPPWVVREGINPEDAKSEIAEEDQSSAASGATAAAAPASSWMSSSAPPQPPAPPHFPEPVKADTFRGEDPPRFLPASDAVGSAGDYYVGPKAAATADPAETAPATSRGGASAAPGSMAGFSSANSSSFFEESESDSSGGEATGSDLDDLSLSGNCGAAEDATGGGEGGRGGAKELLRAAAEAPRGGDAKASDDDAVLRELEELSLPFLSYGSRVVSSARRCAAEKAATARNQGSSSRKGGGGGGGGSNGGVTRWDIDEELEGPYLVAIPTTSGSGAEVTPFASVSADDATQDTPSRYFYLADPSLTPDLALLDPGLVRRLPKRLTAHSGLAAVAHAVEAHASTHASRASQAKSLEALRLLFEFLPRAHAEGERDPKAREKVHFAAAVAGTAAASASTGLCASLANALGAAFGLPAGVASAVMLPRVVLFNAAIDAESWAISIVGDVGGAEEAAGNGGAAVRQVSDPRYPVPVARAQLAALAEALGLIPPPRDAAAAAAAAELIAEAEEDAELSDDVEEREEADGDDNTAATNNTSSTSSRTSAGGEAEAAETLARALASLAAQLEAPATLSEALGRGAEGEFFAKIDAVAEQAFEDQSARTNPRAPLVREIREMLVAAWDTPAFGGGGGGCADDDETCGLW